MNSIELNIGSARYVLKGEESEEHLREVAEMVRRRVEGLKKKTPSLTLQKVAMLAAFDFASDVIKSRKKSSGLRAPATNQTCSAMKIFVGILRNDKH